MLSTSSVSIVRKICLLKWKVKKSPGNNDDKRDRESTSLWDVYCLVIFNWVSFQPCIL